MLSGRKRRGARGAGRRACRATATASSPADLAEPGAAEKLAAEAGDIDVLVANAGLPGTGRLPEFTAEELTGALRVNLEAPMLLARALEPGMIERGDGHMVFVSSLSGKSPSPLSSIYNATKFGLRGFALGLRADLDPLGVGVSLVSPGSIREAGMYADSGAKPIPGLGTGSPEQVAAAVVKAIEQNKVEVAVAPLRQRVLAHFALASPGIAVKIASGEPARKPRPRWRRRQAPKRIDRARNGRRVHSLVGWRR